MPTGFPPCLFAALRRTLPAIFVAGEKLPSVQPQTSSLQPLPWHRAASPESLIPEAPRGSLDELAAWTEEPEKVVTF